MAVYPAAVTVQPGAFAENVKTQDWSSGIFSCCDDMGICCFGFWCCPCLMCNTSQQIGEGLCLPLVDIACGCIPPIALALRVSLRERKRIHGSVCDDCCLVTCCTWCAWCQMAREVSKKHHVVINNTQITVCAPAPQIQYHPPPTVVSVMH